MTITATEIAADVEKGAIVVGDAAAVISAIAPYATFIAGFFPGAASVLAAVQIAAPWIDKIRMAAPLVAKAIDAGVPIAQAIDQAGPEVLSHIKQVYAIFANTDPGRSETSVTADDVSDDEAMKFAGPVLIGRPWTDAETQAWWSRADGHDNF